MVTNSIGSPDAAPYSGHESMTRRPAFWITLALLGLGGAILSYQLFPVAFPLLSVDIQMDRQEAMSEASALADRFDWDPAEPRQAASFSHLNPAFQTYMELEGGGLDELNRLIRDGAFSLYAWRVRQFAEGVIEEVEVRFTPAGEALGFRLHLSEETPGQNLPGDQARAQAVETATSNWGMDPGRYELLESSEEEQPGGRIDHTFVFERSDITLGEAKVRLRLRVAGNEVVEVSPFFHVPESFERRFQDTRDANNSIYLAGTIAFLILFLFLAGGGGMVHLLRQRLVEWKAPLAWGILVAGLMALGTINSLPLAWMAYDTALPSQVFVGMIILGAVLAFVAGALFLALLFTTGEGMMRLGFPDQIQIWKLWAPGVANTNPALGRTLAPYLILGLELGFVVTFYLVTARLAGWWSPASSLVEPDLLATYMPWLTAVSTSLFAALSEETIFRAIPIGAAAIMGRRHGRASLWIWGAIILQAVVFGASHANYPQQPSYARVVEIFPTYLGWGVVCAYFGLIPAIIGHYTYDLVLFSLPLFSAETPGIWFDRFMVIAAGTLPMGVVLWARWRTGAEAETPVWSLNRSWTRPTRPKPEPTEGAAVGSPTLADLGAAEDEISADAQTRFAGPSIRTKAVIAGFGLAGLVLFFTGPQPPYAPAFTITRSQAESMARAALEEEGVSLGQDWVPLASLTSYPDFAHQFVWREGSADEYRDLVGRFLGAPKWVFEFVRFHAAPEERVESYIVTLDPSGQTLGVAHILPEGRPGEALPEEDARVLAHGALRSRWQMEAEALREISAEEASQPNRTDWTFTFAATDGYPLDLGEGRATVFIAGDEVTGTGRYVHIPEDWSREWRADESRRQLALLPAAAILLLLGLGAAILAMVLWSRGSLHAPSLQALTGTLIVVLFVTAVNDWPATMGGFTTGESYTNQLVMTLVGLGLGLAFAAASVGILGALGSTWVQDKRIELQGAEWMGIAIGMAIVGVLTQTSRWESWSPPAWPEYGHALTYFPSMSVFLGSTMGILAAVAGILLLLAGLERLSESKHLWASGPILLLVGLTAAPNPPGSSWLIWVGIALAVGGGIALLWLLCRTLGWAILPGVVAAPLLLNHWELLQARPFLGSGVGSIMGIMAVLVVVRYWTKALQPPSPSAGGER